MSYTNETMSPNDPKNPRNIKSHDSTKGGLLIALFKDPVNAENAFTDLLNRGYKKENITVMMSEETQKRYFLKQDVSKTKLGDKSLQGMGVGSTIGLTVGGLAAGIAALGTSLIIPGLGIVVAGALAAGLAGAGAGALAGGLIGALIGLGLSDEQAKEFEAGIKAGGVVVGVHTKSAEDYKVINNHWKAHQVADFIS